MKSSSGDTPRRPLPKIIRLTLIVVIAVGLGPLLGSVPFLLITSAQLALSGQRAAEFGQAFIPIVIFAYVRGGIIAFVAGTLVAITAVWHQPNFATIMLATLLANVGCYLAIPDALLQSLSLNLVASAFAATICWLLFRRVMSSASGTTSAVL